MRTRRDIMAIGLAAGGAALMRPAITFAQDAATAIRTATGGETIDFGTADLGALDLRGVRFGTPVTLRGGRFSSIALTGSDGVHFLDTRVDGEFSLRNCRNIALDRIRVTGGRFGLVLRSVQGGSVTRSLIRNQEVDNVRICAGSRDILFQDNAVLNGGGRTAHLDLLQMFGIEGQGIPTRVTIRRNFLWSRPAEGERARQGIFITDPNNGGGPNEYRDILVEQNIIWASNKNTLVMTWSGEGCIARNNTLRGSGNLLTNERTRTERNLIVAASYGLPNSFNDVIYKDLGPIFPGSDPVWQDQVPLIEMGDIGATELIAHLRSGQPHGMDLLDR